MVGIPSRACVGDRADLHLGVLQLANAGVAFAAVGGIHRTDYVIRRKACKLSFLAGQLVELFGEQLLVRG